MRSAIFKLASRADDLETTNEILAAADVIFARDENGIATEGCGWSEVRRVDDDHIEIWIQTLEPIMDMVMQDPRLELVQKLSGWPEEVSVEEEVIL